MEANAVAHRSQRKGAALPEEKGVATSRKKTRNVPSLLEEVGVKRTNTDG